MRIIAVSGGVACGKSRFSQRFLERAGEGSVASISCDEVVRELYAGKEFGEVILAEARAIGRDISDERGGLERHKLRELVFDNSQFRGRMESVVHPLVLQRVMAQVKVLSGHVRMALIEVPLLYEVDFPLERDLDLVVAASREVQRRRLLGDRGLEPAVAERILNVQMPMEEKIRKADIAVWNDGSLQALDAQIDHLFDRCETIFT